MNSSPPEIPTKCTVLVVGGGPGGSYAAAALAREGLDVVLLEADVFPRYHIGESMLASMRHLLRFVDLDTTFNEYGFTRKVGAAFKLNPRKREGYTDFLAAGGPENYAWNVVRSEADELMFKHAGKCGAKVFDGVKVTALEFDSSSSDGVAPSTTATATDSVSGAERPLGRPVRATWSRKADSASGASAAPTTGTIDFEYVIDASGRAGLLCTKYLKNRNYNQGLKNVAHWGYWTGAAQYAPGTPRAGSPFFEALQDESGWAWLIPLHNGTTSVGIVMNQELATKKRQALGGAGGAPVSLQDFYLDQLHLAPGLLALLSSGSLISTSGVKSASDYSYSSRSYAVPGARVVGDAGAFIDPYFSSGVHLALTGALSAALTICAVRRGELTEEEAAQWHSQKTATAYTRFLMVVLSAYRQIRAQEQPVLADFDEDNFDRAFAFFRPVIQGAADIDKNLSQAELAKTLDFCAHAFEPSEPAERAAVLAKVEGAPPTVAASSESNGHANAAANGSASAAANLKETNDPKVAAAGAAFATNLSTEEARVLQHIQARRMMRTEDTMGMGSFTADALLGRVPRLERGRLGLDVIA